MTLFPELFTPILNSSIIGRALESGRVEFNAIQIRDFASDRHRSVDDSPYGGGAGMLLRADVLHAAWKSVMRSRAHQPWTILMSPQGKPLTQSRARELCREHRHLIVVCGHYEGVDERFIDACVDEEISIGDYVLTGGELPALVLADCVTRLIPGTVAKSESVSTDSLENGLLKYPQFTRPREWEGRSVPDVLLSGNHRAIEAWRKAESQSRTARKRPDLWSKINLTQK